MAKADIEYFHIPGKPAPDFYSSYAVGKEKPTLYLAKSVWKKEDEMWQVYINKPFSTGLQLLHESFCVTRCMSLNVDVRFDETDEDLAALLAELAQRMGPADKIQHSSIDKRLIVPKDMIKELRHPDGKRWERYLDYILKGVNPE